MLISDFPLSNRTKNALDRAGYKTELDFQGKFLEDVKGVKGLGPPGIVELREYLNSKFKIVLKHKPKEKKLTHGKEASKVVTHFLGHKGFISWGKEMVIANRLLDSYNLEILLKVTPNLRTGSLVFYLTEDGKRYIRKYLPSIQVEQKEDKIQESALKSESEVILKPTVSKPKSLKDFMKI